MSGIEERVVGMKFDNKEFEANVKQTLASLEALNKGLKLEGATKGLTDLSAASKNVSLSNIESGVNSLVDKFRTLSVVGITALVNIADRAFTAGLSIAKSLTVDPINAGLQEYQTNINSIQTILSNTRWQNTGLNDVIAALDELNHYADLTIYNFTEMAHNIGTFTAAGVKLDVATNAIKGIANLAAVSGSSAEQASVAMYQLSQAIATGTVKLIDWNSVVNAGLGGKVFQDALIQTAKVHHVAVDQMIKDAGSFRGSLEKGWLTAGILTETLSHFTSDLNEQQLISMGYSHQQALDIIAMGKDATDAATKVKTLSQLLSTLQEAAGSGWTQTWQLIFGDFDEARNLFTSVYTTLDGFISRSADSRNELLRTWKDLGGRDILIQSIANAFNALLAVIKPIREGFREIFPKTTALDLYNITYILRQFTETLTISGTTADKLRRTFAGVFAIFGIAYDLVKAAAKEFFQLFGILGGGAGDFLEITANIGDFLVELRKAIQEGKGFEKVFGAIGAVLKVPIDLIKAIVHYSAGLFKNFDAGAAVNSLAGLIGKLEPLTRLGQIISTVWSRVIDVLGQVANDASKLGPKILDAFGPFGDYIQKAVQDLNFDDLFKGLNTGLFGAFILTIRNAFGRGGVTGLIHNLTQTFGQLTDTLQTMQNTLRAATLLEIALAIGILAVAVKEISKISPEDLTKALTALTVMFGQLLGALSLFNTVTGTKGIAKIPLITGALISLAIAVDLLVIAVKKLGEMDMKQLRRGLTAVTIIIGDLVAAVRLMPPSPGIIATAIAMNLLSGAVIILAQAVQQISALSWGEITKGLTGVGSLLLALALFTKFAAVEKGGVLAGAGIVLISAGIKILASAMADFAKLSWEDMAKGLSAIAGGLIAMGVALTLIPPTAPLVGAGILIVALALKPFAEALKILGGMSWADIGAGLTALAVGLTEIGLALTLIPPYAPLTAAGILIVAASLGMIVEALKGIGSMTWVEIAKGLITLGVALGIIAVAITLMSGALPGAAAILIVAGALAILTPVLLTLGNMSWGEIVKGLVTLAGVFVVLGLAGLLLTPVIPTLLGLGIAVALIGVGLLAAGVGILAFSIAVTALSVSGAALTTTLVAIVSAAIGLIPTIIKGLGVALVTLAAVLGNSIPALTEAIAAILIALLNAIIKIIPKLEEAIIVLIDALIRIMEKETPKLVEAGFNVLTAILQGVYDHAGGIIATAVFILAQFIRGLGYALPDVLQAGAEFIIDFINGLADTIRNNSEALGKAGGNLATAIIEGMAKGLLGGSSVIADAAKKVAKNALQSAKEFLGISSPSKEFEEVGKFSAQGMAVGLDKYSHVVSGAAEEVGKSAVSSLARSLSDFSYLMNKDIEMQPTITPVIDLTNVRKSASEIGTILNPRPISVDTSYEGAKDASLGFDQNQDAASDGSTDSSGGNITYNQYNTSPKAISEAEIYRQTKNQLSQAKGVVTANANPS
jgi:tape measure domain-containing protein